MRPHHRFVDLRCGTLRGGLPVIEYLEPGQYHSIDVRSDALAEARRELEAGLEHKRPILTVGENID